MTNEQLPAEMQNVAREVIDFVKEIMDITKPLAPLGEEAVGIALDWLRYYRYRNALALRDRINEIHMERGIPNRVPIPARLGIPLLEAASMEDDPTIQEMWAGLAANATDPNKRQDAKKVFTHILSNLEPVDTVILRYLSNIGTRRPAKKARRSRSLKHQPCSESAPRRSRRLCTISRASDV